MSIKIGGVPFGKKSVDDVLAVFVKAQEDLTSIADARHEEMERHRDEIMRLSDKVLEATDEANRATAIAGRINWILHGGPGPSSAKKPEAA